MAHENEDSKSVSEYPTSLDPGLACLALLAKYFEKPGDYDQLRHRHGAPTELADDIALVRYAKECGFKASAIDSAWDRLARTPLPCLARTRDGGWFIMGKVAEDKILIQDPLVGRPEQLSREELEARCSSRWSPTRSWYTARPPRWTCWSSP